MTAPDPLAAEITAAIADYCRVWPVPYDLSPNLKLASRALAQLHPAPAVRPPSKTPYERMDFERVWDARYEAAHPKETP